MQTTITYTALREKLAKTMDEVCKNHTPVIITRANASPVVMISLDDFKAMEETQYLLRNPKNAKRLLNAIDEIESMINNNAKKCFQIK